MSHRVKLEIDPSILENNLNFGINSDEPQVKDLFTTQLAKSEEGIPWKSVIPKPGFVAKVRTLEDDKVFINICHCTEIPTPEDISEDKLLQLLESEDDNNNYVVPMSIGDLHLEADKSKNLASTYDIAISTKFFNKIEQSSLFKNFFLTVILEAIEDKYKLQFNRATDVVILKNRKSFGTLRAHRIQQRAVRQPQKKLIEELPLNINNQKKFTNESLERNENKHKKKLIEIVPNDVQQSQQNQNLCNDNIFERVRIIKIFENGIFKLIAFIKIPVLTGKDLELNVGEDRIVVYSPRKNDKLDFFLPININANKVTARYLVNTQILRIELPIKL